MKTKRRRTAKAFPALKPGSRLKLSDRTIRKLSDLFGLLADESRLKILFALCQDGELHVSAICNLLDKSQPAVSHHLSRLRNKELVVFRRAGKHNVYAISCDEVCELLDAIFRDAGNGHKQIQIGDFILGYKSK